jgi:hypothetical protein
MESPTTQNMADGQDTDMRYGPLSEVEVFESILTGAVQLLPSKVTAFPPPPSTATQKLRVGHDSTGQETPPFPRLTPFGSALAGGLQVLPLNMIAFPLRSMAAQKLTDGHDTACRLPPGSMVDGLLQDVPLKVTTLS